MQNPAPERHIPWRGSVLGTRTNHPRTVAPQLTERTGSREYKSSDQRDNERKQHKVTQEHGHTYAPSSKANLAPQRNCRPARIRDSGTTLHTRCVVTSSGRSRRHPAAGAGWFAQTEQKYPVLLEYANASFERIKQRLRHL